MRTIEYCLNVIYCNQTTLYPYRIIIGKFTGLLHVQVDDPMVMRVLTLTKKIKRVACNQTIKQSNNIVSIYDYMVMILW